MAFATAVVSRLLLGRSQEFYIPLQSSSIHFLKTKLCVGCTNGFEIVDLESLDTQGLLDPADASLEFVHKRENLKPLAIYRIDNEFLLCYDGGSIMAYVGFCMKLTCIAQNSRSTSIRLAGVHGRTSWCIGRGHRQDSVRMQSLLAYLF